jgi:hypothetical protein
MAVARYAEKNNMQFVREKFDVILIAALFATFAIAWIALGFPDQMREIVGGLFIAFLTATGIRPRPPAVQADTIRADVVETAKTETGDIVAEKINEKEKTE